MAKPIVAIVGRPNVGKSMLFNKLIGKRVSIVRTPPASPGIGSTGDGLERPEIHPHRHRGHRAPTDSEILSFMREQAEIAVSHADVIVFLTDIKTGLTASDQEVASMLLRSGKPIVLAVTRWTPWGLWTRTTTSFII